MSEHEKPELPDGPESEPEFPDDQPESHNDLPAEPEIPNPPPDPITNYSSPAAEAIAQCLMPPGVPEEIYAAEREWPFGRAETQFTLYRDRGQPQQWTACVELLWRGCSDIEEQPDYWKLRWEIIWYRTMECLAQHLSVYLFKYCPYPVELLTTMRNSLPAELKKFFQEPSGPQPEPQFHTVTIKGCEAT